MIYALLVFIVLIGGCTGQGGEQAQAPSQQPAPKTEIKTSGQGVDMVVSPSIGNNVRDIVTIAATKVPGGTRAVFFAIQGFGIEDMRKTGPNLGMDSDPGDGWSFILDTRVYPDSVYTIYAFASSIVTETDEGVPPLGAAQAQIIIKNEGSEETLEPPAVKFYKSVQMWPVSTMNEKIAEAKSMGASVVGLFAWTEYDGDKIMLQKNWDINLKTYTREAYRNGLAVSVFVILPEGVDKRFPYREGSDIDLPHGYDMANFTENMKDIYGEIAIFAAENKIHSISIPAELEVWIGRVYEDSSEYWEQSGKVGRGVAKEIRKHYDGKIIGNILGGMWGFDTPCCYTNIPLDKVDLGMFDMVAIGTGSDYRTAGSPAGPVEEALKRVDFTRMFLDRNKVKSLILGVGGSVKKESRVSDYGLIFEKTKGKVEGFAVSFGPTDNTDPYDKQSIEAAKTWYPKVG